jgi:enoyl-CoA hydratase/carnithine racemase
MADAQPVVILDKQPDVGVARIVLNRPERRNAINHELAQGVLDALEEVRGDPQIRVVVTVGAGPSYCSGLDLYYLRSTYEQPLGDWDRPRITHQLFEGIRLYPKVTIAQVQGYCLGGGLALMNSHDLVVAAASAQIGMPEIIRGSFGQSATGTLFHSGVPMKKAAMIQLSGRNVSGVEADRLGLVSMVADDDALEAETMKLAREVASRLPTALIHAKIAVQMGRDLTLAQALRMEELIGLRQRMLADPLSDVADYLHSQKGGATTDYRRPDV